VSGTFPYWSIWEIPAKTSWLVWIGVVLMLGAMLMYVLSDDEAIQPGGPPPGEIDSAPVEAAP